MKVILAAFFLVFVCLSLGVPQTTNAKLKRDTERVHLPKFCLRYQAKFEREWIKYPIQKSPVESLVSQDVQWVSGRCAIIYQYAYDADRYVNHYEALGRDMNGLPADEFLKTPDGKKDLTELWHENFSLPVSKIGLPEGATVIINYLPLQHEYPEINLVFHGEEI